MKILNTVFFLFFFIVVLATIEERSLEAAELDISFGDAGKVSTSLGFHEDRAFTSLIQPDGKILVAGSSSNSSNLDFVLLRYNSDGSLDSTFNGDGTVLTDIGGGDDIVNSLALLPDGRIVAGGFSENQTDSDFALVCYFPDGSLDRNFGNEGIRTTAVGNGDEEIAAVGIGPDNTILVTGPVTGTSGRVVALARYTAQGDIDTSFGQEGLELIGIGTDAVVHDLVIAEDGSLFVSGTYSDGEQPAVMLLKFSDNGILDSSYGEGGIAVPADLQTSSEGFGLALQENGMQLVAGSVGEIGERDAALFAFDKDGSPSEQVGESGVLIAKEGEGDDTLFSVVGGAVPAAVGYTTEAGEQSFLQVTLEPTSVSVATTSGTDNGVTSNTETFRISDLQVAESYEDFVASAPDAASYVVKSVSTDFDAGNAVGFDVAVQPDGKVVAVGYSEGNGTSNVAVSRYTDATAASSQRSTAVAYPEDNAWFIETKPVTDITVKNAVGGGYIQPGAGSFTQRGVVFSTAPYPVLKQDNVGEGVNGPTATITAPIAGADYALPVTLLVTTDGRATCRYGTASGIDYNSVSIAMNVINGTGGQSHEALMDASILTDNASNTVYVHCRDANGTYGPQTSVTFDVNVTSDNGTGSAATIIYPEANTNHTLPVDLSVTTDVAATCRYGTISGQDYSAMPGVMTVLGNTSGRIHQASMDTPILTDNASNSIFVRCRDAGGIDLTLDSVTFTVGTVADVNSFDKLILESMAGTRRTLGNFLVAEAVAANGDDITDTSSTTSSTTTSSTTSSTGSSTDVSDSNSVFDISANDNYIKEGYTSDGAGTGHYGSMMENLKPATFYYVRAYAVSSNGAVYYGRQIGFKTQDACFIATAAYGSFLHPCVSILRNLRDSYLAKSQLGRDFISLYYQYSPPVAELIKDNAFLKIVVQLLLLPIVTLSWLILKIGISGVVLGIVACSIPWLLYRSSLRKAV